MGGKRRTRPRRRRDDSDSRAELKISGLQTSVATFVRHDEPPHYVEYFLFRPDHSERKAAFIEKRQAGEEPDLKEFQQMGRFAILMIGLDERGFTAHLFLDRKKVDASEVDAIIDEVYHALDQIPSGPDGGVLIANWMEEVGMYSIS
jgi:hypothetical protein